MSGKLLDNKTALLIRDEGDVKLKRYASQQMFTDTGGRYALDAVLFVLATLSSHESIAKVGKTKPDDPLNLGCMTVQSFTNLTRMTARLETRVTFARPTVVDKAFLRELRRSFGDRVDVSFWEMLDRVSLRPVKTKKLSYWLEFQCPHLPDDILPATKKAKRQE